MFTFHSVDKKATSLIQNTIQKKQGLVSCFAVYKVVLTFDVH